MAERTVQLSCVVPTPEKFTVQLLTVVLRQAGPASNMFVYVVTQEVGVFRRIYDWEGGISHQPVLVSENLSDCIFVLYQNICSASFSFIIIHASDRWTELR